MPTVPLRKLSLLLALAAVLPAACATSTPRAPALPSTMKAVRIHAYGGLDTLRHEDVPRPSPGPGEVLLRVQAAGVNPVDWAVREGWMHDVLRHTLPLTLGWDVAGVVAQAGEGATRFQPGAAVYAHTDLRRDGTYAEYVVVREREVAPRPRTLDAVRAAGVPLTALAAWQALFDTANLQPGQTVLIHAGAGGVGTMAIQLAKAKGARVITTASAHNHAFLRELGADEVIDYRATRFEEVVKDVDVVLDTIGGETQERSWRVLKPGGFLVSLLDPPSPERARAQGVRAAHLLVRPSATQLEEVGQLIDAGRVRPVISQVLPLSEARRAHELSQTKHTRGKLVLRVAE
jgi:NADPH:quinone reductase-like Zn-dependent oxidoreductase